MDRTARPPVKERSGRLNSWKTWTIALVASLIFFSVILGLMTSLILSRFSAIEMLFMLTPSGGSSAMQATNILLLGIDNTAGVKRSDTIMVLHVDPKNKSVSVLSIPRDMMVVIPGVRVDKINHAYAFGGPDLACATTSNFLGIPVRNYIKVNVSDLEKIIDRIGGVTVNVDQRMYYVDYSGGLNIDLKPGLQKLKGHEAMGYLRFRHDAKGDIGRINRQQQFLQELGTEIAKSKNFVQIYQILLDMFNGVETNMSTSQVLALASMVRQAYEVGSLNVMAIYGNGTMIDGIYYMQPDMDQVVKTVNKYFR